MNVAKQETASLLSCMKRGTEAYTLLYLTTSVIVLFFPLFGGCSLFFRDIQLRRCSWKRGDTTLCSRISPEASSGGFVSHLSVSVSLRLACWSGVQRGVPRMRNLTGTKRSPCEPERPFRGIVGSPKRFRNQIDT